MLKIKKIQFFNMIEILLALAVIAIGMTSVLGLFPVGLNASRNAVAENCSADIADQMVTYLRVISEINNNQYSKAFTDPVSPATTPLSFADSTGVAITNGELVDRVDSNDEKYINEVAEVFLKSYSSQKIYKNHSTPAINNILGLYDTITNVNLDFPNVNSSLEFKRVANEWAIFKVNSIGSNMPRVFFIVQGPNCTENDDGSISPELDKISRPVDYSAMALVWKSTVQINRLESGGGGIWSNWPSDTIMSSGTISQKYEFSGMINIELSWPLELPYAERKKRYYQIVISRPN